MILGEAKSIEPAQSPAGGWTTIDDLLRRAAARRPDALALIDPPNREQVTGVAPRRLTFAQTDRVVSAVAAWLHESGLSTDAVVAIQLPNVADNILALLGVLRAGMIAAPLPLLWRQQECVNALSRVGAKALITCGRIGTTDHATLAMEVAAQIFSIRAVCGFGDNLPDGVASLEHLFGVEQPEPVRLLQHVRMGNAAPHVAAITWDVTSAGLVAVARNHNELLAGGLEAMLEGRIAEDAVILSSLPPASFAGIALTLLPWLFAGGTLVLHHPFEADVLAAQFDAHECAAAILPGPLIPRLSVAGLLSPKTGLRTLLSFWRSPERLSGSAGWLRTDPAVVDIAIFGETGLVAGRRSADGKPEPLVSGPVVAPRGAEGALQLAEIATGKSGTVALRGAMVPRHAFPASDTPDYKPADDGYVDTGYPCRIDPQSKILTITAPPPGLANVGGYRFALHELNELVARANGSATLAALPDAFAGFRLAGHAADRARVREALTAQGANPLVVCAFRDRGAERPH